MPTPDAIRAGMNQARTRSQEMTGPSFLDVWIEMVEANCQVSFGIPKQEVVTALDYGISVVLGSKIVRFIDDRDIGFSFPLTYEEIINIAMMKIKETRPKLFTEDEIRMASVQLLNLINSTDIEGSNQLHKAFDQSLREFAEGEGWGISLELAPDPSNEVSLRIQAKKVAQANVTS